MPNVTRTRSSAGSETDARRLRMKAVARKRMPEMWNDLDIEALGGADAGGGGDGYVDDAGGGR